jgi:hypothetical protein
MDQLCLIVLFVTFKATEEKAKMALNPAEEFFPGEPAVHWFCQGTSLEKEYSSQAQANPPGHRYFCDNAFINNDADVLGILEKALTTSPSKETYMFWYPMCPWS